ncbi:S8 family peptidase [Aquimonas voraii]|uniref:Peptidase inhibitor I9 n=1 Tax=Aquimonas voraii TaxID=265719 RepID=A0A1G6XIV0_9GAMM|nr:S8 family peptidase [Aquimonas voraii]SDD77992.1 Peptidase inhibitor I9 [Aquimonas voraii]
MKMKLAVLCSMIAASLPAAATELKRAEAPIKGQYIVVLKDSAFETSTTTRGAPSASALSMAADMAVSHKLEVDRVYEHAIKGFVVRNASEKQVEQLLWDDRVAFVEEDGMVYLDATQTGATWGLDRIDQRNRPLNGTYIYNTTATNVRAYIIDSGVLASHSQFGGRVSGGASYINDGRGTSDCNGHGTHVAGTVAGSVHGVAKGARIVPVRVFGCSGGSSNSTIIAGIDWVRANHVKPAVANMSLGGGASSATDTATNNLINAGVTVVVAAGNSNANACNYSPARVANAITVGSTTSTDARSSFSNFGTCVNIFAPGSSITSAWYTSNSATNTISGTSMASPHVAGVAALYLAGAPSATPATVRNYIYNRATTNVLTGIGSGSPNRMLYSQ